MNFQNIFLLAIWVVSDCLCETELNSTVASRREILEEQARTAYTNACFRLQELSNWMTVLFRIKSVWARSTVNQAAARSEGILRESDRRYLPSLPSRPKTTGTDCSMGSVLVTAQTFVYLQSQMILLKMILGRNILRSSKIRLEDANTVLMGRMKMLDTFNITSNAILSNLSQNTKGLLSQVDPENWKMGSIVKDLQEGRFLQYLQAPTSLLRNIFDNQEINKSSQNRTESMSFFQNLGRNMDKIFFSSSGPELNATAGYPEESVNNTESVR